MNFPRLYFLIIIFAFSNYYEIIEQYFMEIIQYNFEYLIVEFSSNEFLQSILLLQS